MGIAENPIRVVVAESSAVIRDVLFAMLADHPSIEVAALASNRSELRRTLAIEHPDVVVTDIRISPARGDEGIRISRRLQVTNSEIGMVVLSQYAEPAYALALLRSGTARAYMLKERVRRKGELASVIEAVARGDNSIDSDIVATMMEARSRSPHSPLAALSPSSRQILASIAEGRCTGEIAASLGCPTETVEEEIESIFLELGLEEPED